MVAVLPSVLPRRRVLLAMGGGSLAWAGLRRSWGNNPEQLESAKRFMNGIITEVMGSLFSEDTTLQQRHATLKTLLLSHTDVSYIARFLLGRYARRATPAQLKRFEEVLVEYITLAYVQRISSYRGEAPRITQAVFADNGDVIITSALAQADQSNIYMEWRFHSVGEQWKLLDIVVEGLSMIVTQRDEFVAVLDRSRGKVDLFMDQLETLSAKLRAQHAL